MAVLSVPDAKGIRRYLVKVSNHFLDVKYQRFIKKVSRPRGADLYVDIRCGGTHVNFGAPGPSTYAVI